MIDKLYPFLNATPKFAQLQTKFCLGYYFYRSTLNRYSREARVNGVSRLDRARACRDCRAMLAQALDLLQGDTE
jgi:hypothetical protein